MKKQLNRVVCSCTYLLQIWKQEYKNIFSNKSVFMTLFITTIGVAVVYSYVYSQQVLQNLPVAIVDESQSTLSRSFIRDIEASEKVKVAYKVANFQTAKDLFYEQKVNGIIVVPKNYAKYIYKNEQAFISVYCDGAYLLYYREILTAVKQIVAYTNAMIQVKELSAKGMNVAIAKEKSMPIQSTIVRLYNPEMGYGTFLMPTVFIIIIQTTMLSAIGMLGRGLRQDKKMNIHKLENTSYLNAIGIVLGKTFAYTSIGLVLFTVLMALPYRLFNFQQKGSFTDVLVFVLPYILAISFLGITLKIFFKSSEDAAMVVMYISIPALLLTGISWPWTEMPLILKYIAHLLPSTLGAKGFVSIHQAGATLQDNVNVFSKLWMTCGVYFITSVFVMRKLLYEQYLHDV